MNLSIHYDSNQDIIIFDRTLKEGPGVSNYGLAICQGLALPDFFIERTNNLRVQYNNTADAPVLSNEVSHFNASKLKGVCERCKNVMGDDVHHMQYQQSANEHGFIGTFHKNHRANLMNLCNKCHDTIHENKEVLTRVKTTDGYKVTSKYFSK